MCGRRRGSTGRSTSTSRSDPQGVSAKALAAILADSLPGEPLSTITAISGDVVYSLFGRELSMGKNLGLLGMLQMCQAFARRQQALLASA